MIISRYLDIIQDILNEIAAIVNIFFNSFFPSSPSAVSIISQFFLQMIRSRSVYQKNKDNKYERFSIFNVSCAKRAEEDLSVLRILLRPFYAAFPVLTHAYRSLSITFSIDLTGVLSILFRRFWNVVTDWPLYSWTPFLRLSAWKISFRLSTFQKIIFGNW